MKLCKCDVCDHKFKPNDHAVSTVKLHVHDGNHPSWPHGSEFDLCADCTTEIGKFLKIKR